MRLIALLLLLTSSPALAQEVVLMLNMNYSSEELKAVKKIAAERGQRFEMIPPESTVPEVEPMFRYREKMLGDLITNFPNLDRVQLNVALQSIMRLGAEWRGNPQVATFLGNARMNELRSMTKKIFAAEAARGTLQEQLNKKAAEFKANGDRVDSLILSSHSDGSNLTGETTNRLSANDIGKLKADHPEIFDARHVMLMGCYNLTQPNHQVWRYNLFPKASMIAGFGFRAPSRYDPKSAKFITDQMTAAAKLDEQMLATGHALDPELVKATFKALASFTTDRHPGVVDYCYQVVEGKEGTWAHNCDEQWREIYEKKSTMLDYWSPLEPEKDPPQDGGGDLRAYYNLLQMACPAKKVNNPDVVDDPIAAERYRVTARENVIRLLYWWNVQNNFSTYYAGKLQQINEVLIAMDVDVMPKLDGTLSRVKFVREYHRIMEQTASMPTIQKFFENTYRPLLLLKGEDGVAAGESMSVEATLDRGAIPFNWIEGSTVVTQ